MNRENNAHVAGCGTIIGLVFCAMVGAFFHFVPVHTTPAASVAPIAINAPADCLPSGSGGPCIPFSDIEKMMEAQPDTREVIPANPAAANEEKI